MELVNLKSLTFNSYENHAELIIESKRQSLSYSTTYLINVLEVNRVINYLQKRNNDQDLHEWIQSKDYSDFQEFYLDIDKIENCLIDKELIDFMSINSFKKQIRA